MFSIADKKTLKMLSIIAYQASTNMRRVMDAVYTANGQKKPALAELERLKKLTLDDLAVAFSSYSWVADTPFDWIPEPYMVVAGRRDDCDGSTALYCACRPQASAWLICNFDQGRPLKFERWHYIAYEPGLVCSNFDIEATNKSVFGWVRKNYRWANALVKVDWQLKNPNALVLETHSL